MIPESFPVFTVDDILDPPSEEYEVGNKKTTVGWLKHLFLYYHPDGNNDLIMIRLEDHRDYEKAFDTFRKINTIKDRSLDDWEDRASRKQQAAALNKLRRKMGYVHEYIIKESIE